MASACQKTPRNLPFRGVYAIIKQVMIMINKQSDLRGEVKIFDIETLMPKDHLLRKIEKAVDWSYVYGLTEKYYCADNGRPTVDPVVLTKIAFLQHIFGIPSIRRTVAEIEVKGVPTTSC